MFKKKGNRPVYLGIAVVFLMSFATLYGILDQKAPMYKLGAAAPGAVESVKPTVRADTAIVKEIRYLCGDRVTTTLPTTSDLVGLEFSEVIQKYPPEQGWSIDDTVKNTLILVRLEERVCMYHQDFRHLGISDGYLAVYEGPLGFNQKVLQQENILTSSLPQEMQEELWKAMGYHDQAPDIQGRLKTTYEFETEEDLAPVLENFDEYK